MRISMMKLSLCSQSTVVFTVKTYNQVYSYKRVVRGEEVLLGVGTLTLYGLDYGGKAE